MVQSKASSIIARLLRSWSIRQNVNPEDRISLEKLIGKGGGGGESPPPF